MPRWGLLALILGSAFGLGQAGRVCDLTLSECPGKFSAGTVKVPPEAIWLTAKMPFCTEFVQITNGKAKPPSVVFIIDNSGSMDENDPEVARFEVVSALLDKIYAFAPNLEVGLVIFTRRLAFDNRDNKFFKSAFPADTAQHDAFVPLTALDKDFGNGRTGLDTLKALLAHDARGNLTWVTKRPASRNNSGMGRSNTRDGTDITLGFQAAKAAMKDSKSDKNSQYFIFLSDGTPSTPDNGREGAINEFMLGSSVPTTFTVFFDTQNSTPLAPGTIVQMTANIKGNGYSTSNPRSGYWAIKLPGSELQDVLQKEVIGNVLSLPTTPVQASIASGDSTFRTSALDTNNFIFSKRLALRQDTTHVQLEYTYAYVDTSGGKKETKLKPFRYPLTVLRAQDAVVPKGMGQACRDQADISLYRDGKPVSVVTAEDDVLEARLTMPDGSVCKGCALEVLSSTAKVKDHEDPAMFQANGYLSGTFRREVSVTPSVGDGRLQHLPGDSIVVVFISPENPLDQVRKAFPYKDVLTVVRVAPENYYVRVARAPGSTTLSPWLMVAPAGLRALPAGPADRWEQAAGPLSPEDSLLYLGLKVEASRAFGVDMRIYTNLGDFVNKVGFTVGDAEFPKLDKSPRANTRWLKLLWDGRDSHGNPVATGAYVIKTTVTLLKIPDIAEDNAVRVDYRRVGILRSR